jgi:molybdate transport system substrate-binding protein
MALRFISAGAAHGLVSALGARDAVACDGSFGAVGAMLEKFGAGEPCDVVILTHAQIADLVAEGKALGSTATDLGSVATSLAVRDGAPIPDVSGERALRECLLAADAIYFPDPSKATAGIHFAKVLDQLGIAARVAARVRTFPNGATAMRAMADAPGNPIGCTQATEILATRGARIVAPLPRGFDLETVYTAAVCTRSQAADGARRFVASLGAAASRDIRATAGFRGYAARPADKDDFDAIRSIVQAVLGEYGLACQPGGTDRDLQDIASSYLDRGGAFDVVAAEDGRIAGCCGVYPIDPTTCELRKMYLLPGARGHGLGSRLLRRALAFARGQGFRRVELETASVLKDAIALYTRKGFTPIARTHLASRCDQAYALDL